MNRKKRILMVGEASYTYSGFGTYTNEVLKRLAATNKYEIAELASYGHVNDPRDKNVTWQIYANAVKPEDSRAGVYNSQPTFQFGEWRLDRVLLDFKPDIVWDIRDPWMLEWEKESTFRQFFHWVIMPTVDSAPQQEGWIESFKSADGVFTYSDFGLDTLRKESNNKIKLFCSAPPGTDLNVYCPPVNKEQQKTKMGLLPSMNIIGTVMRNQRRKLYPDLLEAFRLFIEKCYENGLHELANNTYLFIHSSYPDAGWDFPKLLKLSGISHKVIFSYLCKSCGQWFASPFQDILGVCPHCTQAGNAVLPNVGNGVSSENLAEIMKCFDVYIQYAICEGFGMPQVEAAACGVPVMAVNYSAMEDVINKTKGIKLPIAKMYLELETQAYRAMPDNEGCAEEILKFFKLPKLTRNKMGELARKGCEEHYCYDKTTKIWENYFDSVELTGLQGQWDSAPPNIYNIPENIPENLNNSQFLDFLYYDVLRQPELRYTYTALKLLNDLNVGIICEGMTIHHIDRNKVFQHFKSRANNKIISEKARCGIEKLPNEDFIEYAHMKKKVLNLKEGDIL